MNETHNNVNHFTPIQPRPSLQTMNKRDVMNHTEQVGDQPGQSSKLDS